MINLIANLKHQMGMIIILILKSIKEHSKSINLLKIEFVLCLIKNSINNVKIMISELALIFQLLIRKYIYKR